MKICTIGTGYVGLVAGACLATMGNNVICVDKDEKKLKQLKSGIIPIYEPGLEELIKTGVAEGRLEFSSNLDKAVKKSEICFIAVGTPQDENGKADLSAVFEVANQIGKAINDYKIIAVKSTVPVGTVEKVEEIIKSKTDCKFDVISNPEFLKQGAAVEDFLKPDRVIIGSNSQRATDIMQELYKPHTLNGNPVIIMDIKSAEMTKYASNTFLAMKISFINEIANICEKTGADIQMVRQGMCSDKRIGHKFLFPGLGFGGSCFPKDLCALLNIAQENNCEAKILKSVWEVNQNQRTQFIQKIRTRFKNNLKGLTFGVWGLSFKPQTNDLREAPSITIINALIKEGANIVAYDPKAMDDSKEIFKDKIKYAKNSYEALENADAMLLLTEWHEFRAPDFEKIYNLLKQKIIFDGRNQYEPKRLEELSFEYHSIGRK